MRGEFIDLAGERIYYYAAGTRGLGEPIVLIHGFPTSSHLWIEVVAKLPAGHRVIVVDLLGFGRSDAPPDADFSIAGHAARVIRLLDALRIDQALIAGHDFGGAVALWVAMSQADRVTGVALIDGATSAATTGWLSRPHPIARVLWSVLLKLPIGFWLPIARRGIARQYADEERGHRSAEMYLMPFLTPGGARVLQRHVIALMSGQIAEIAGRSMAIDTPVVTLSSPARCFSPEESPSEVAATIAKVTRPIHGDVLPTTTTALDGYKSGKSDKI
jgi:pimeloyl-ACP methyl ester carboxylesterase